MRACLLLLVSSMAFGYLQELEPPLVLAHRAGAEIVPENTLEGWLKAKEICSPDVFELDVWLTADDSLVVIHDGNVDRTTNGTGHVNDLTFAELRQLNAGYRFSTDQGRTFPWKDKEVRVPTLAELFDACPEDYFNIEIKDTSLATVYCLRHIITGKGMADRVLVGSEHQAPLDTFRILMPGVATSGAEAELRKFVLMGKMGLAFTTKTRMQAVQVPEYFGSIHIVTRGFIKRCHRRGIQVHVWTVNQPQDMQRLWELGVDGIITDRPDAAREVLEEFNRE